MYLVRLLGLVKEEIGNEKKQMQQSTKPFFVCIVSDQNRICKHIFHIYSEKYSQNIVETFAFAHQIRDHGELR
jgi:hypothetical protein